ncbi:MAG TPA: hypothetical protein VGE15_01645, partial [Sphingobacteriaceae bacterium]
MQIDFYKCFETGCTSHHKVSTSETTAGSRRKGGNIRRTARILFLIFGALYGQPARSQQDTLSPAEIKSLSVEQLMNIEV